MKKHIPNIITSCNLLSGAVATMLAVDERFALATCFIVLGAVFDFFDGMSARLLRVSNPIGKELDSLADDITFGLAPAAMLYCFLKPTIGYTALIVLLMAAFSALRLAKFNLDERQTTSFIGLATPANALFWASLVTTMSTHEGDTKLWFAYTLVGLSLVSCHLLIAEIPFFSLKFKNLHWQDNKIRYIFLIGSGVVLLALIIVSALTSWAYIWAAGAAIILWYILLNLGMKNIFN